jgi:outer membrane protein assembly factor BamB
MGEMQADLMFEIKPPLGRTEATVNGERTLMLPVAGRSGARVALLAALIVMTASLASAETRTGSAAAATVDWPTFHNTNDRVGYNANETILDKTSVFQLSKSWSYTTGNEVWSSPAVVGGTLYIGSDDFKVYALNATTGTKIWSYATGGAVRSSPAVVGGVVYVGSDDDKVYALNASTGTKIWSYTTGGDISDSSPLVVNGAVYVGALDGYFYAINTSNGTLKWSVNTWNVRESAAYYNGTIYVGSDHSMLFALDANTGDTQWTATLGGMVRCTPSVSNGVVYVGADDYKVRAYNATSGTRLWTSQTFSGLGIVRSAPAVWNNTVYIDTGETSPMSSHLYALDATTGSTKWSTEMADYSTSSPAVANGVVYTGSFDHQIHTFDAVTGEKLWASGFTGAIDGGIPASVAVLNGWVYVGSEDKKVYGFTDTPGDPIGSFVSIKDNSYSPKDTIGHDIGTAVLWTNNGTKTHTVTDNTGMGYYGSGNIAKGGTWQFTFIAAGIYKYHCTIHSEEGTVKAPVIVVPTSGGVSTVFTVTWATASPPSGYVFDVRIKRPGDTVWSKWKTGVTGKSGTFTPDDGKGTYQFQAHIKKTSNGKSADYSAAVSITVS